MLHDDDDVMTIFSMFEQISKLTCLQLYITTADTPTQTCAHPPLISTSSLNLKGLNEYLDETINLESSFEETPLPIYLILILLFNDL